MAKKETVKKADKKPVNKKYWKITCKDWTKPILRPKSHTSDRVLASIKAKDGYVVEEA